jgi:beta-xylosidase
VPGDSPEGPHIYKRDGSYYLMIAEGGSQQNHSATIARSSNLEGPYESYANNPIITARQTDNYFQSVGHCDLLNDASNNSWAVCISRRSGPGYEYYPMSRETSLTPVTWNAEGWPVLDPIRGNMTGPLPTPDRDGVPGDGLFTDAEDDYATFDAIPRHFLYYGVPNQNGTTYNISSGSLVLSGVPNSTVPGLSFIGRRQISSLFTFNVSMDFALTKEGDQVGTSMFTFPGSRIDLGVTRVNGSQVLYFAPMNKTIETSPAPIYIPFSQNSTTFQIRALNQTTLSFAATVNGTMQTIEHALTSIVSTDFSGECFSIMFARISA